MPALAIVPDHGYPAGTMSGVDPSEPESGASALLGLDPAADGPGGGGAGSDRRLNDILNSLSNAVAIADPATWVVRYQNERFGEWFPAGPGTDALIDRLPDVDLERAGKRLLRGRTYRKDIEIANGPRPLSLQIEIRGQRVGGEDLAVIETQNIAKRKEAEYMLDSYSRLVERQTRELEQEKERAEKLLLNIMPRRVYEELKDYGTTTPQAFDEVSVLMLDFAGFTEMAIAQDPTALIAELNDVFTSFDRIVEHFRGERIKTIGDAYMAVAGVPESDPDHARNMARVALRMRRFLARRNANSPTEWRGRIGIGCGPVIGSIVGVQKYVYDIFGPAVNMASRLENLAEPMQILLSPATADLIRDEFIISELGEVEIKGFGRTMLFSLDDESRKGR